MANTELQALICISITSYTCGLRCEGFYKGCCQGSSWNSETQQCERCIPGYSGVNCSSPCPYPYYGVDCQKACSCSRDLCDVSSGCKDVTTRYNTIQNTENDGYSQIFSRRIHIEKSDKCHPGYVGRFCRARCIYPYYGEECEAQCNCSEQMCDVTIGCKADDRGPFYIDVT